MLLKKPFPLQFRTLLLRLFPLSQPLPMLTSPTLLSMLPTLPPLMVFLGILLVAMTLLVLMLIWLILTSIITTYYEQIKWTTGVAQGWMTIPIFPLLIHCGNLPAKAVDININIKEFLNMTLAPLLSSNQEAIQEFYCSLTSQATASNIDLCPLDYFEQVHALWPKNLPVPIVLNMSRFLLLNLEQHDAINRTDAILKLLYTKHITLGNSKLSAYHFLHALLLQLAQDAQTGCLVTLPRYKDTRMDVVMFTEKLLWYCHNKLSKSRFYTQRELSKHYLQELDLHVFLVQVQLAALDDVPPDEETPFSLRCAQLAIHFAPTTSVLDISFSIMPIAHRLGNDRATLGTKGCTS
jgi:hypothetical protein